MLILPGLNAQDHQTLLPFCDSTYSVFCFSRVFPLYHSLAAGYGLNMSNDGHCGQKGLGAFRLVVSHRICDELHDAPGGQNCYWAGPSASTKFSERFTKLTM